MRERDGSNFFAGGYISFRFRRGGRGIAKIVNRNISVGGDIYIPRICRADARDVLILVKVFILLKFINTHYSKNIWKKIYFKGSKLRYINLLKYIVNLDTWP